MKKLKMLASMLAAMSLAVMGLVGVQATVGASDAQAWEYWSCGYGSEFRGMDTSCGQARFAQKPGNKWYYYQVVTIGRWSVGGCWYPSLKAGNYKLMRYPS
jgi:hypothetical protein